MPLSASHCPIGRTSMPCPMHVAARPMQGIDVPPRTAPRRRRGCSAPADGVDCRQRQPAASTRRGGASQRDRLSGGAWCDRLTLLVEDRAPTWVLTRVACNEGADCCVVHDAVPPPPPFVDRCLGSTIRGVRAWALSCPRLRLLTRLLYLRRAPDKAVGLDEPLVLQHLTHISCSLNPFLHSFLFSAAQDGARGGWKPLLHFL